MVTINIQIASASDSALRRLTGNGGPPPQFSLTWGELRAGASGLYWYQGGMGLRFRNVLLDNTMTITAAYLRIVSYSGNTTTEAKTRISAEDVDDAPTFADNAGAFDARWANRTTARVDWDDIASWVNEVEYDSPSIISVIQEIVTRGGWASGNDIVIFWEDFEDRTAHASKFRATYSYSGSPTKSVILHIEYALPAFATTQAVTAIHPTIATGNGNVTELGSPNPTAYGVCWNTGGSPTISDDKTDEGAKSSTGAFTTLMTNLIANTTYYVKAYVTNAAGTNYGNQVSFTTNPLITAGQHAQIIS